MAERNATTSTDLSSEKCSEDPCLSSTPWNREGFSLIHKAVVQENNIRIKYLLSISPTSLEVKTRDKDKLTPLLLAAAYGCVDAFHYLLKMGAKIKVRSSRGLNTTQCALINQRNRLVSSILDDPRFTVIEDLFGLLGMSENLQISELTNCLKVLNTIVALHIGTEEEENAKKYLAAIRSVEGVEKINSLIPLCLNQKEQMLEQVAPCIINIMKDMCLSRGFYEDILKSSMPENQVKLMEVTESCDAIVGLIHICNMLIKRGDGEKILVLHAPKICLNAVRKTRNEKAKLAALTCMMECVSYKMVAENFHQDGLLEEFIGMLRTSEVSCYVQSLLIGIITKIASSSEFFRSVIFELGAVSVLVESMQKNRSIMVDIIDFLCIMCTKKGDSEDIIKNSSAAMTTLLYVIKHYINHRYKNKAFMILWLITGDNTNEKRGLAGLIGPVSLINMLKIASDDRLLTAVTALYLLSPALYNMQGEIVVNGAVPLLLGVIQAAGAQTQLKALETLENCSHDIALRPNREMQTKILEEKGIRLLLKLQASTQRSDIKLQAICTLSALSIASCKIKKMILSSSLFSLKDLIHLLTTLSQDYTTNTNELVLVCRSICFLAYNSLETQTTIFNTQQIPIEPYRYLMTCNSQLSTEAAFQMIVLANILDERENIVALSIRHLVGTLRRALDCEDEDLQVHICTLVSSLLQSRAGIRQAFIAVDLVSLLVQVILSPLEQCRITAAIALSYITKDRKGCRTILGYCRRHEKLYSRLVENSKGYSLDKELVEGWRHFKTTHIQEKRGRRRKSIVLPSTFRGTRLFSEKP